MAVPRDNIYVWITWLSKVMAGEQSCEWASWFKAHHTYEKLPSDFDVAAWSIDHTRCLRELHIERKKVGEIVTIESQNSLKFTTKSGITIAGKPDLVAVANPAVTVYDVKTGQPRKSDSIQVMLYMHLIPLVIPRHSGIKLAGCVVYNDSRLNIPPEAVDSGFIENFHYFLEIIGGTESPLRVPGESECRFCDIPHHECSERHVPEAASDAKAAG